MSLLQEQRMAVEDDIKLVVVTHGDLAGLWPTADGNSSHAGAIALWTREIRNAEFNIQVCCPTAALHITGPADQAAISLSRQQSQPELQLAAAQLRCGV